MSRKDASRTSGVERYSCSQTTGRLTLVFALMFQLARGANTAAVSCAFRLLELGVEGYVETRHFSERPEVGCSAELLLEGDGVIEVLLLNVTQWNSSFAVSTTITPSSGCGGCGGQEWSATSTRACSSMWFVSEGGNGSQRISPIVGATHSFSKRVKLELNFVNSTWCHALLWYSGARMSSQVFMNVLAVVVGVTVVLIGCGSIYLCRRNKRLRKSFTLQLCSAGGMECKTRIAYNKKSLQEKKPRREGVSDRQEDRHKRAPVIDDDRYVTLKSFTSLKVADSVFSSQTDGIYDEPPSITIADECATVNTRSQERLNGDTVAAVSASIKSTSLTAPRADERALSATTHAPGVARSYETQLDEHRLETIDDYGSTPLDKNVTRELATSTSELDYVRMSVRDDLYPDYVDMQRQSRSVLSQISTDDPYDVVLQRYSSHYEYPQVVLQNRRLSMDYYDVVAPNCDGGYEIVDEPERYTVYENDREINEDFFAELPENYPANAKESNDEVKRSLHTSGIEEGADYVNLSGKLSWLK